MIPGFDEFMHLCILMLKVVGGNNDMVFGSDDFNMPSDLSAHNEFLIIFNKAARDIVSLKHDDPLIRHQVEHVYVLRVTYRI